jgi:BlaI family transcriptional regulator, penicillinase repressor
MKRSRPHRALPQISDAELVVMKVVWDQAPVTANVVVRDLADRRRWKPKTIHTLLSRLVKKGALEFDKKGREYHFRPLVEEDEYVHAASRSFLSRFFDGEVAPFLACLMEREKLSRAEIEELRRILDARKP